MKQICFVASVVGLLCPLLVSAQSPTAPPHEMVAAAATLNSPQATMRCFLESMNGLWQRAGAWDEAITTLDRSKIPHQDPNLLARQLYGVINRIERVDVATLPDVDAVTKGDLQDYQYFPQSPRDNFLRDQIDWPKGKIVLRPNPVTGAWQFSADTMAQIEPLYEQMRNLPLIAGAEVLTPSEWIEKYIPQSLVSSGFLSLKYWQWLAIFLVVVAGLLLDLAVRSLVRMLIGRLLRGQPRGDSHRQTLRRTLRPYGYLAASAFWLLALRFIGLEEGIALDVLHGALVLFVTLSAALAAWRTVDLVAEHMLVLAQSTTSKVDDVLVPLLRKSLKIFIMVMGVIYACNALQIPIGPLVASLGIAGVAFSFAAKDTVENFFGSVAVLLDRPFDVGDWVVIDDVEGIVEEVGFRSTRVRTFYNSQISVPNANLVRAKVDNYGRRQFRRWKTYLGVQYDTTPDQLNAFCEGIRELLLAHPYTRKDYYQVYCNEFGPSSLNILLYMFFEVPDWNTELRERHRFFVDILRLADQLGIRFAFPTTTVHLFQGSDPAETEISEPRHDAPTSATEHLAKGRGIQAADQLIAKQSWTSRKPDPVVIRSTRTALQFDNAGNPVEPSPDLPG